MAIKDFTVGKVRPTFGGEYSSDKTYPPFTIVYKDNVSFESLKEVPSGQVPNPNTNTEYWAKVVDGNAILEDTNNKVKELEKNKANTNDFNILKSRVDNIATLPEGSTTADAELIDIRVDVNGKTYGSAGEAVRGQIKELSDDKDNIINELKENMTDLAPAIKVMATGSDIVIKDSADGRPFKGLRVFGRTEQVKTTGAQLFDAKTFLKSQIEKGVVSINSDGKIVLNGVIDANNRAFTVTLQPGTYTLSADKPSTWHIIAPVDGVFNQKITADVETTYNCYIANGTYDNVETTPMINAGLSALPWEPYTGGKPSPSPEYPQEIVSAGENGSVEVEVKGKNLFDADRLSNGNFVEFRGVECYKYVDTDKGFAFDFSENNSANQLTFTIKMYRETNLNNASGFRFEYSDGTNESYNIKHDTPKTVVTTKEKILKKITSIHAYNEVCYIDLSVTQLEYGTVPTPYESYRTPQLLTLSTPNGLPGVPVSKDGNYTDADGQQWICDEIDLGRGTYVQRTAEKDIYESQNTWGGQGTWGNNDNYNTLGFYSYINGTNGEKNWERLPIYNGICNYFCLIADAYLKSIIGFTMGDYIAVRVPRELLPDWDENNPSAEPWVNWLRKQKEAGNPVIVRYALKTPIERDLTPEEITAYKALRTYGLTTVVSNDAGAGMEVTYVADTKIYIDNKFAELNTALLNAVIRGV